MSVEERLKLMEARIKYGDPDFVNISKDERDWLIEQAKKVEWLNNELIGYKLSNQSLSNALDKAIKEKY